MIMICIGQAGLIYAVASISSARSEGTCEPQAVPEHTQKQIQSLEEQLQEEQKQIHVREEQLQQEQKQRSELELQLVEGQNKINELEQQLLQRHKLIQEAELQMVRCYCLVACESFWGTALCYLLFPCPLQDSVPQLS